MAQIIHQIEHSFNNLVEKLQSWLDSIIVMLPNFILSLIIIVGAYFLSKVIRKLIIRLLARFSNNVAVNKLIGSLVYWVVILIGIFISLGILKLDKTVTSLLAGIGIAGLAIGLAFKDAASNFMAGIYMAINSPINVGDILEYDDHYGTVKEIGLRATTITTMQGQDVIIPNHLVIGEIYKHYTINGSRRIDLEVGISYGDDLEKAETITLEAIKPIHYLKTNKPIDLFYTEFGDSSINFILRYWVDFRKETDYLKAVSDGIKRIKKAYNENDITITFPIRTLDFGIKGGTTLKEMISDSKK